MNCETIIVVPCYNEARRLDVEAFERYMAASNGVSFLFVDDGSTDETPRVLEAIRARHSKHVSVYRVEQNGGKAEAVRRGMLAALRQRPAFVGYWDADLATPLDAIGRFVDVFRHRKDIALVMGSRVPLLGHDIRRRRSRQLLGRMFAKAASRVLRLPVYDTQCGAKVFRVTPLTAVCFETPFRSQWVFDVEILARLTTHGVGATAIYELPLDQWQDVAGSKIKPHHFLAAGVDLALICWRYSRGCEQIVTTMVDVDAKPMSRRRAA